MTKPAKKITIATVKAAAKKSLLTNALGALADFREYVESVRSTEGNAEARAVMMYPPTARSMRGHIETVLRIDPASLPAWIDRDWNYLKTIGWIDSSWKC